MVMVMNWNIDMLCQAVEELVDMDADVALLPRTGQRCRSMTATQLAGMASKPGLMIAFAAAAPGRAGPMR